MSFPHLASSQQQQQQQQQQPTYENSAALTFSFHEQVCFLILLLKLQK
jgi:hypothetical protein